MGKLNTFIGTVREVEDTFSKDSHDGLRIRATIDSDGLPNDLSDIPWAFPLLPKTFQSVPKVGEGVIILTNDENGRDTSQRYYIGPLISQPQYNTYCIKENGTSLLENFDRNPIEKISNVDETRGSFPNKEDIAVVGRGQEDIILRYKDNVSEIDLRAGIRKPSSSNENKNIIGNVLFNDEDAAYVQLKHKNNLAKEKDSDKSVNSAINVVANKVNIMSNMDDNIAHNLNDKETLVSEDKIGDIMDNLHQVPKGDDLVDLLKIMKDCILYHVHPWAGMEQCGDNYGAIDKLNEYDIDSILSKHVRIS
jgi:hypothetical protein